MAARGLKPLTPDQRAAVEHDGNLMLTACPGSGKTRTLIAKLIYELESVRGTPRSIACITYTNTAVEEMESRSLEQCAPGDERSFTVCTIHSFCLNEILRPYAWLQADFAGSRQILTREDPRYEDVVRYALAQVNQHRADAKDFEAFESLALNSRGEIIGMAAENDAVRRAAPHYWRRCRELGLMDFSMIVYDAFLLLRDNPFVARSITSKYAWFLVDEFQDTTELQTEIMKLLFAVGTSRFFAVGDLAQSIFGFTGADPSLVAPFAAHIGARTNISLSSNYRSSPPVIANAEALFARTPPMISAGDASAVTIAPTYVGDRGNFAAMMEVFIPALADHGIRLGEAAILCREWAPLIPLARQLRDAGIPVVGPGARPYKRSRLFASLAEQLCGAVTDPTPHSIFQLERALRFAVRDVTGASKVSIPNFQGRKLMVRLLSEARRLSASGGAAQFLDDMSTRTGEILLDEELVDRVQAGLFFASVQEMKADIARQNVDLGNLSVEDLGLFASADKALRLSTIHAAKGREYKAVALIDITEGKFPHYYSRTPDKILADMRLLYVGVTRARQVLLYTSPPNRFGNPRSRFLGNPGIGIA